MAIVPLLILNQCNQYTLSVQPPTFKISVGHCDLLPSYMILYGEPFPGVVLFPSYPFFSYLMHLLSRKIFYTTYDFIILPN